MMKWAMTVILMVMTAVLLPQAAASDQLDSAGFSGSGGDIFSQGSDAKKMENKIAEALAGLKPAINPNDSMNNINLNISQNGSLDNSTVNSKEHAQLNPGEAAGDNSSSKNTGSGSKGSSNGFYATTASRHEIGKSGIDSSMFLSGNFEMEKSIRFQDQGF